MLKIENDNSQWKFWDLFKKTIDLLKNENTILGTERILIRFMERLPTGDYSNLRDEWNKRE